MVRRFRTLLLLAFGLFIAAGCSNSPSLDPLEPLTPDGLILAFGDSLTEGYGAPSGNAYPDYLSSMTGHPVYNAGISGEISKDGLARFVDVLDDTNPELVILCHGGNDILRNLSMTDLANNLRDMIEEAESRGIQVVLLGVPEKGLILSAAPVYSDIATSTGVAFIPELLSDVLGDDDLKSDLIHPNAKGYRFIAESLYIALNNAGVF